MIFRSTNGLFDGRGRRVLILFCSLLALSRASGATPASDDGDVVLRALTDELKRSMTLRLEDLDQPYFIQYGVEDTSVYRISATYGALLQTDENHSRELQAQVRVGNYTLDNSNFSGRGRRELGGNTELPLDDDYLALRHAIWLATDSRYKSAVETLTQKRAYMRDRTIEDRPPDFAKVTAITSLEARVSFKFDQPAWEDYARSISAAFQEYAHIQNAEVSLTAGAEIRYLVNSEGSRLRSADTGVLLRIHAEGQAADGERISDQYTSYAVLPEQMPRLPEVLAEVKKLADRLNDIMRAPVLEEYTGPVLLDELAAPQFFRQLLARGVAGQTEPVGSARRSSSGGAELENRLGKRILPVTFQIYDDPRPEKFQNLFLTGSYVFDDEGVPAQRVEIVVDGKLQGMVMSRAPTKQFNRSTGHGRRGSAEPPRSTIGCLYVESAKGESPAELKKELIDAAEAEGLKYGLRVTSLQERGPGGFSRRGFGGFGGVGGTPSRVSDPITIYKVYVADGHEELVRGVEFNAVDVRSLRRIIAAGNVRALHNSTGMAGPASSVIAPAVLFEELELTRIKQETEKKPFLEPPQARKNG